MHWYGLRGVSSIWLQKPISEPLNCHERSVINSYLWATSEIEREESDFLNATYSTRSTAAALAVVTATLTDARLAAGFSTRWSFAL